MGDGSCLRLGNQRSTLVRECSPISSPLISFGSGVKVKICVEYLSMRDIVQQFSEVTGEKAYLGLELDTTLFEATRYGDHPLAETCICLGSSFSDPDREVVLR